MIAKDQGRDGEEHSASFVGEMMNMLRDERRLRSLGPKPALCRWYSWLDSHAYWKPLYHLRPLLMLYWGLGCGVVTKNTESTIMSLLGTPEVVGGKKETMRDQAAKSQRAHSKGKNKLHVSLLVLLNPLVHRKANCVFLALNAMRKFHGGQVRQCMTTHGV